MRIKIREGDILKYPNKSRTTNDLFNLYLKIESLVAEPCLTKKSEIKHGLYDKCLIIIYRIFSHPD